MTENHEIARQAAALDDEDVWVTALTPFQPNDTGSSSSSSSSRSDARLVAMVGPQLRDFEASLRCFICHDFFRAPVSVQPCQHTFCSECIRKKFALNLHSTARKAACACCNVKVDTKGADFSRCLIPNRTVDDLVHQFRRLRRPLLQVLRESSSSSSSSSNSNSSDSAPNAPAAVVLSNPETSLPTNRRRCARVHSHSVGSASVDEEVSPAPSGPETPAPVPAALPDGRVPEREQRRAKMARVMYKGQTRKQLVALCRSTGLSVAGNETALQRRHADFVTLYNAECDSLRPRSRRELLAEMAAREQGTLSAPLPRVAGGVPLDDVACLERLKQQRKVLGESSGTTTWTSVTTGHAQFDADVADRFQHLIQEYHARFPPRPRRTWEDQDYDRAAATDRTAGATKAPPSAAAAMATEPGSRRATGPAAAKPTVDVPPPMPPVATGTAPTLQSAAAFNPYHRKHRRISDPAPTKSHSASARPFSQPPLLSDVTTTTSSWMPTSACSPAASTTRATEAQPKMVEEVRSDTTPVGAGVPPPQAGATEPGSSHTSTTAAALCHPAATSLAAPHPHSSVATRLATSSAGAPSDQCTCPAAAIDPGEVAAARSTPLLPADVSRTGSSWDETPCSPPNQHTHVPRPIETAVTTTKRKSALGRNHRSVSAVKKPKPSPFFPQPPLVEHMGPWVCGICTLRNETNCSSRARCEACNAFRNDAAAPTEYMIDC